jgi:hypothetical protein
VSADDPQRTQEWDAAPDTPGSASLEQPAQQGVEAAEQGEHKLSRKERKAKERSQQAEAEQARRHAAETERLRRETAAPAPQRAATLSGANVTSPGLGSETDPSAAASASVGGSTARRPPAAAPAAPGPLERPEVMAGIAFGGAFVLARILKRVVD